MEHPDDVWLYNAAGLSYSSVDDHELALEWLAEGIELAIRTGDPEGLVPQLSEVRRTSLAALGRDLDELEQRANAFVAGWRDRRTDPNSRVELSRAADEWLSAPARRRRHRTVLGGCGRDGLEARARYTADRYRLGEAIDWPPGRNDPCCCGSGRNYKKCCGAAAPMHGGLAG